MTMISSPLPSLRCLADQDNLLIKSDHQSKQPPSLARVLLEKKQVNGSDERGICTAGKYFFDWQVGEDDCGVNALKYHKEN